MAIEVNTPDINALAIPTATNFYKIFQKPSITNSL
jgi:hypothetical protein